MKTKNKKIAVIIVTIVVVLVLMAALMFALIIWYLYDPDNEIAGDNGNANGYSKGFFEHKEFDNLDIALEEVQKKIQKDNGQKPEDQDSVEDKILYQAVTNHCALVFVQEKQTFKPKTKIEKRVMKEFNEQGNYTQDEYVNYLIVCYEFVINDNGTYSYIGGRNCHYAGYLPQEQHDWKTDVLSDISMSTDKVYSKFVNPRETYGVLPVWGVSDNEQVKNMTVDGQDVDEVIELTDDGKTYYFWFIQDMQTRNAAKDIVIDVKE